MTHIKRHKLMSSTQVRGCSHYIRGLELMKLIFAILDVLLTMGLTRCYKTEGFLYLYLQFFVYILRYFY